MSFALPDIPTDGRTVDEIRGDINWHMTQGRRRDDLRLLAGRLAEAVAFAPPPPTPDAEAERKPRYVDELKPGDRLFGVLVV